MPKPTTLRELVDVIRRSRLIDETKLVEFLRSLRASNPQGITKSDLLKLLISNGHITAFQADQLALGKWRGFVIGSYRLQNKIGSGGMGQVFLAQHMTTMRPVAIKVLNPKLVDDPVARVRFTREARAAATMTHPNIVRVIDVDAEASPPYLVMEYIDGFSLQAIVATFGTMTVGWTAYCGHQIAQGLQVASEVGLVHRDIKPANLLMDLSGHVKILDLGIALVGEEESLTTSMPERLILGTADYLAPEQALDSHAVDCRADIYAMGGTLYFLLTGHPPYPDGSSQLKLIRKQSGDPISIQRLRPDVPDEFAVVIHRLLARNVNDRYQTPTEAVEALAPFVQPDTTLLTKLASASRNAPADQASNPTPSNSLYGTAFDKVPSHDHSRQQNGRSHQNWSNGSSLHAVLKPSELSRTPLPPVESFNNPEFLDELDDQATVEVDITGTAVQMPLTDRLEPTPFLPPKQQHHWPLAIAISCVSVVGIIALVLLFARRVPVAEPQPIKPVATTTIPAKQEVPIIRASVLVVSKTLPNAFRTVRAAIDVARNDSRIEIRDTTWSEVLQIPPERFLPRNLTIVGMPQDGRPVTWTAPDNEPKPTLVVLTGIRDLTLENFVFDGRSSCKTGVIAEGGGITIKQVTMQKFIETDLEIIPVVGDPTPTVVTNSRFVTDIKQTHAIYFKRLDDAACEAFEVTNCRFEGPYVCALRKVTPTRTSKIESNRFWQAEHAIDFQGHPLGTPPVKLSCIRNTFADCKYGISILNHPIAEPNGITISRNYFDNVENMAQTSQITPRVNQPPVPMIWDPAVKTPLIPRDNTRVFRATFDMPAGPKTPLWLDVNSPQQVFVSVNGMLAVPWNEPGQVALAVDISKLVKPGRNLVAVRITRVVEGNKNDPLGFLLRVRKPGVVMPLLMTGPHWKTGFGDLRDWMAPTFDDSKWPQAAVVVDPFGKPIKRTLSWMGHVLDQTPTALAMLGTTEWNAQATDTCQESFPPLMARTAGQSVPRNPDDDATFLRLNPATLPYGHAGQYGANPE